MPTNLHQFSGMYFVQLLSGLWRWPEGLDSTHVKRLRRLGFGVNLKLY